MMDTVKEYFIKSVFGNNWPIAAIILIFSVSFLRFIYKCSLPKYFKFCVLTSIVAVTAFAESYFFSWDKYGNQYSDRYSFAAIRLLALPCTTIRIVLLIILSLSLAILFPRYRKIDRQLGLAIKDAKSDGDKTGNNITAWNELQKISVEKLTPWQKKKYDKHRLYLRVDLGNMAGAELECEKYKEDKPFYHFMKAIIFNFKGKHREELEEIKAAEDACDGDTDPLMYFQIIHNRGVALIGAGEYRLAQDCFKKAIEYGNENNVFDPELWLNTYYNYVFNQTRITPEISIQECHDMLELVKKHIDIEDPKQYITYSNIIIEILRQKKASREQIDEVINGDFEYLVNAKLTDQERCSLEATTARMVCTGRLNPELVVERLTKDIDKFLQLPMPLIYRCFKEIDFMFKDLRGSITERNQKIRETAHWYIVNQAANDLEKYRSEMPSEAVYEICYCLKEKVGLMKYRPDRYNWDEFLKNMRSAQLLYKENELLADYVLCCLDVMDEALAECNLDSEMKPVHLDVMREMLSEVEKALLDLMEHPILNQICLRLSLYCLAMGNRGDEDDRGVTGTGENIEKSKSYYRKFQELGNFAIDHFAPWLRGRYSILSLYMFVIGYIETVDKIASGDLSGEIPQIQEWFREFHKRNGYFEAVVLGKVLGTEVIHLAIEFNPEADVQGTLINTADVRAAWLVMPAINTKIKCNGREADIRKKDGVFSDWKREGFQGLQRVQGLQGVQENRETHELVYCVVDTRKLMPEMRQAIERITQMIKAEMPDYLVSSAELNRLAEDSWFDKGAMGDGQ